MANSTLNITKYKTPIVGVHWAADCRLPNAVV